MIKVKTNLVLVFLHFLRMLYTDVFQYKVPPNKHLCAQRISPPAESQPRRMLGR